MQEKEDIKTLWQTAKNNAEILENELKLYKCDTLELLPKQQYIDMKQSYEDNIKKLYHQLKLAQKSLDNKQTEIAAIIDSKKTEIENVKKLETKLDGLKTKIAQLEDVNDELRNSFHEKERQIQNVMIQNSDYREKVTEALQVVQAALNEKDGALLREAAVKSDIQKLNEELDTIVNEIKDKFKNDISKVREDANRKYEILLNDFNKITDELKIKSLEIEKYQTKSVILQNQVDKLLTGGINVEESQTSKLLILEKNLEATFQKLLVSEKQNIQIKSDYEALKNDMEQMANYYDRMSKSKEVERTSLQNSINKLQAFIKEKDLSIKGLNNEIDRLRSEITATEKEYKKYVENLEEKLDNERKGFTDKRKELSGKIESTEKFNKKLILETKEIFSRMDSLVRSLKADNHNLKRDNETLVLKVEEFKIKLTQCKEMMRVLNLDFTNINSGYTESQEPNILS